MHDRLVLEKLRAGAILIILIQGPVSAEKRDMAKRLPVKYGRSLERQVRSHTESAHITPQPERPFLRQPPDPSQSKYGIGPFLQNGQ